MTFRYHYISHYSSKLSIVDHINSHLHYLRGKIRLHSVKARSRHNAAKANDLIERAIEVYEVRLLKVTVLFSLVMLAF